MNLQRYWLIRLVPILAALVLPGAVHAQIKVITSGGFATAFRQLLPDFERETGIKVTFGTGASQGSGPDTIGAQLRRGEPADMVIMAREGLDQLIKEGRIVPGTEVDLAQAPMGVAVRAGAPKPDLGSLEAFKKALIDARSIAYPGSVTGIFMTTTLFPRLGLADEIARKVQITSRGVGATALVAEGKAEMALQPVSELVHVPGVEYVGPFPPEAQYISVFSTAIVAGSKEQEAARRLIAFLASERAAEAIKYSGMEPPQSR